MQYAGPLSISYAMGDNVGNSKPAVIFDAMHRLKQWAIENGSKLVRDPTDIIGYIVDIPLNGGERDIRVQAFPGSSIGENSLDQDRVSFVFNLQPLTSTGIENAVLYSY